MTEDYQKLYTELKTKFDNADSLFQREIYPNFTDKHRSYMAKNLTKKIFNDLKDRKTENGVTLYDCIRAGTLSPHLTTGITAGDEECYETFKEIFHPIIMDWHKYDAAKQEQVSDLNPDKIKLSDKVLAILDKYVVSTRIRAARSLRGHLLPSSATPEDRLAVETKLKGIFEKSFTGDLEGKYYSLGALDEKQVEDLRSNGFLFQKPKSTNVLYHSGAARDWPHGRGIFHNNNRTCLAWVNEEDHCRIISMEMKGNIKSVFARFCKMSDKFKENAEIMHSKALGFIGTCPSNLGTGLRASVMVILKQFNEDVHLLEDACAKLDLQPRGSRGEYSAAEGGKWDISNKQRIGFSEVQLVQKLIDGLEQLIKWEEMLVDGKKDEVKKQVSEYQESK